MENPFELSGLAAKNALPRYPMRLTQTVDGSGAVHVLARPYVEARGQTPETFAQSDRDRAREASIHSGRHPQDVDAR